MPRRSTSGILRQGRHCAGENIFYGVRNGTMQGVVTYKYATRAQHDLTRIATPVAINMCWPYSRRFITFMRLTKY